MKKIPKFVSLLLVVVVLASLMLVGALPAGAVITPGTVTVNPATVNAQATYTIAFSVGAALTEDVDTITIVFPAGTQLPDSIPPAAVSVGGTPASAPGTGVAPAAPSVDASTRTVVITVPAAVPIGATNVVFSQAAVIKNPTTAKATATASVATSLEAAVNVPYLDADPGVGVEAISPKLTLSPTSGKRGSSVTVTGVGFTPSVGVTITSADGTLNTTATADASGGVAATVTIQPTQTSGLITVRDLSANNFDAAANFTVTPSVTASPASGLPGTTVTLTGSAYTGLAAITATVGGAPIVVAPAGVTTTGGGSIPSGTTVVIPLNASAGVNTISVTAGTNATTTFEVLPRPVAVTPESGNVGTRVSLSGGNMTGNGTIMPTIDGAAWITRSPAAGLTPGTLATAADALGITLTDAETSFVTAGVAVGDFVLNLTDGSSGVVTAVTAATTLTSTALVGGTTNAWAIGDAYAIARGFPIASDGNWQISSIAVPSATGTGARTIRVMDSAGRTAQGTFSVVSRSISVNPASGPPGSQVVVMGAGFERLSTDTTVTFAGGTPLTASVAADGSFSVALTAPTAAVANDTSVTVTATDTSTPTITASGTFKVTGATVSVDPSSAQQGQTVTVSGMNFVPFTPLTSISIGPIVVTPAGGVNTDASGAFTASVLVTGAVASGATTITVLQGAITEIVNFTVTTAPVTVNTQLQQLGANLVRVWGFTGGTWKVYDPAAPALSDLSTLTRGQGYFINVGSAQTLVVGGNSYNLSAGWNLIGWLG